MVWHSINIKYEFNTLLLFDDVVNLTFAACVLNCEKQADKLTSREWFYV